MDSGLLDTLAAEPGRSVPELAQRHDLDPERLGAFCLYLANEGYLVEDEGWQLTRKAQSLKPFQPGTPCSSVATPAPSGTSARR